MGDAKYRGIAQDRHVLLHERYAQFVERLTDVDKEPVAVYDALPERIMNELKLIREVSATLQAKKDEDMKRVAQAAKEREENIIEAEKKEADE